MFHIDLVLFFLFLILWLIKIFISYNFNFNKTSSWKMYIPIFMMKNELFFSIFNITIILLNLLLLYFIFIDYGLLYVILYFVSWFLFSWVLFSMIWERLVIYTKINYSIIYIIILFILWLILLFLYFNQYQIYIDINWYGLLWIYIIFQLLAINFRNNLFKKVIPKMEMQIIENAKLVNSNFVPFRDSVIELIFEKNPNIPINIIKNFLKYDKYQD